MERLNIDADANGVVTEIVNFGNNIYSTAPDALGGPENVFTYDSETSLDYGDIEDLFTDAANRDYTLVEGSAAIGFGNTTYAPATDINGVTRGVPPDAGAYTFVEGSLEILFALSRFSSTRLGNIRNIREGSI